ncbi:MAG TPA: TIGR04282 family arsenosugar biosynthesis glycosyltransferase [Ktedonobacterales bacterium]
MRCSTSVVIPALNEEAVIGQVVTRLWECPALQAAGIPDIVVVDNGSDDATAAVAGAAGARVVSEPRRGYGRACLAGVLAAKEAEVIVLMDGDGSDVPEDVLRVWEPVRAGVADLAMGSRARGQCEPGALTPQQRVGNAVGALLLKLLYGVRVSDIGPLRAIRRETLLRLEMQEMTYGWSAEMLAKAGRLELRIQEIPVDYRRRAGGSSKVAGTLKGTIKASWRILRTIARYRRWQPEGTQQYSSDGPAGSRRCKENDCPEGERGFTTTPGRQDAGGTSGLSALGADGTGAARGRQDAGAAGGAVAPMGCDCASAGMSRQDAGATGGSSKSEYKTIVYAPGQAAEQREAAASRPRQALFLVARLPLVGQTKTRLGQAIGHEAAARLYQAFLTDLGERFTRAAARDGYDLFWFYAAPDEASEATFAACVPAGAGLIRQAGGDFAARLWQGFETLAGRGYERVLVLGSDSPHVPAAWVARAFASLETHDVVIGPARDGGYYLLGQRGAPVDLFSGITMSTPTVHAETLARAQAAGLSVALAPATFDVDEADDLDRLREALRAAPSSEADCAPATQALLSALPVHRADLPLSLSGSAEEAGALL